MIDDAFPFPLTEGIYDTSPKMARLYKRDGSGITDGFPEFIFDSTRKKYWAKKLNNLVEKSERYRVYAESFLEKHGDISCALLSLFARLCPKECSFSDDVAFFLTTQIAVHCTTGEISFNAVDASEQAIKTFHYLTKVPLKLRALDALALHIEEDFALTARNKALPLPNDYLEFAHICFPSHWDPRDKIGKNFSQIHRPVANNAQLIKAHETLVNSMFERGPFTRFVWGVAFSDDLDRHPQHIKEQNESLPKTLEEIIERAFLRVERQVTHPLVDIGRSFFTIRVFIKPIKEIRSNPKQKKLLHDALLSMNDDALRYKGLVNLRDPLCAWLSCEE